jgi:predicted transcriptional regulator
MRPLQEPHIVTPDTPAIQALQMMSREDVNQLPVVSNGRLEGIFSRTQVVSEMCRHYPHPCLAFSSDPWRTAEMMDLSLQPILTPNERVQSQ